MNNSQEQIEKVIADAEKAGLSHFRACIVDSQGRLLGKRYHVSNLRRIMTDGTGFVEALNSAIDPGFHAIETSPFFDFRRGFADATVVMDAESARRVPFADDGVGLMLLGQFNDEMANMCPRALLSRALDKLVDLGYQVFGGYELECTPLAETPDSLQTKSPAAVELASGFTSVYSFVHESMQEALFADLLDSSSVMDVEVDSIHSEFVNMIEVGLKPQRGLRMADNAALYKSIAKIVGKRHNLQMSFMAMLNNAGQSSGAHLNLSLRDQQDGKAFFDDSAEDNVSQVQRFFIGGMQRHLPELFLMLVPNLNSFKRFAPGQFAPKTNTWGINNKTVAHRVINLSAASSRIETRIAGADVNPYLALLAVVTAGRLGIQNEVEPEDPVEGNGMEAQDDNPFPENFTDAIEKFKSSGMAKAELGEAFVNGFASDRQWQIDQFNQSVTDWELRMFYDV